ncbi:MAG: GNAT family N-acetyltransferase [Chlorobiaceae bacterium]|nr:GNAT family N-acetyltransferase [Chlorobiaceae bacterium]
MSSIAVSKVITTTDRSDAMSVIEAVFVREKQWIEGAQEQLPEKAGATERCSWFIARVGGKPAGVMRLLYDPSFNLPKAFEVSFEPGVDIEKVQSSGHYAEIGRFMILPEYRRQYLVALRLMRSATAEVVERGYTHFITDVFEGKAHSPLNFHTRILGFEVIGRHLFGELNCSSTRIILTLDILKLYNRIKDSRSRIYQELLEGIRTPFGKRLSVSGCIE